MTHLERVIEVRSLVEKCFFDVSKIEQKPKLVMAVLAGVLALLHSGKPEAVDTLMRIATFIDNEVQEIII